MIIEKRVLVPIFALFGIYLTSNVVSASNFDVHARDMTYSEQSLRSKINWLGHLGVEYDGLVYNMIPENSSGECYGTKDIYGKKSCLHLNTPDNFKYPGGDKTKYWGTKYDILSNPNNAKNFLYLSELAGNDYSYKSMYAYNPSILYNERTKTYSLKRGYHRCDTFTIETLSRGGRGYGSFTIATPAYVYKKLPYSR